MAAIAFAETANLAVKLSLSGNFTSQMAKARASLRGLDKESRGFKAGAQIGTGIRRGAILAVAGIGALTALVAQSVKDGQEAANVQKIYAQAIANSGKVSQDYVTILDAQQKALMNLAGVDDELIKTSQTRLIQMGLTGKQVEKATPLILDFAKATGVDLLTATKLFGKAAKGNTGALARYGVQIDKAKAKVDPFGAAVEALNGAFGGTTRALSGSLDTRIAAFQEGLKNIREEAGMKLLPVLTRIVDVAGKELVPAFAKFVDRILPQLEDGLNGFADLLSNGGAAKGIQSITDALGPMVELVKIAAAPVKAIVDAFLKLPKEVQTVLVGAFAVNKLTGGLVTNAAGGLVEALGKAVIGGIKAPLVNVQGGVVNVGGIPGGGGSAALKGGDLLASLGLTTATLLPLTVGLIAAAGLGVVLDNAITNAGGLPKAGKQLQDSGLTLGPNPVQKDPGGRGTAFLGGKGTSLTVVGSNPTINLQHGVNVPMAPNTGRHTGENATGASSIISAAQIVVAPMSKAAAKAAASAALAAAAARSAASASMRKDAAPSVSTDVKVTVNVTAGGIKKTVTVQERYGPAGGSRSDTRHLGYAPGGA